MFQYRPGAWVGQVRQPELDGIPTGLGCELVHERLGGEHIEVCPQGPQRRCRQRHRGEEVIDDLARWKVVSGNGVATRAATALLRRLARRSDFLASRAVAGGE